MKTISFISGFFLIIQTQACSPYTINISSSEKIYPIGKQTFIYIDESNSITKNNIIFQSFIKSEKQINTFPVTKSTIWIKFAITNNIREDVYLKISEPSIDSITVFELTGDHLTMLDHSGFIKPFKQRQINEPNYYFRLNLKSGETGTYYVRLKMINAESMSVPLSSGSLKKFYELGMINSAFTGILVGAIFIVILFNLALYIIVRDRSYILFILFIFFVLLFVMVLKGITFQFLWPEYPKLNFYLPLFASLGALSSIAFSGNFLHVKKNNLQLIYHIFNLLLLYFCAIIILNLSGNYSTSLILVQIGALAICIILPGAAIYQIRNNYKPAIYYLMAWVFFFAGIIAYILQINNIIEANFITRNGIPVGLTLETIIMSFAVGYRIKNIKNQKKQTELKLLESYRENEYLIREQNRILEEKVLERSLELEKIHKNMVYQEKLASLGQLSTGIAHEIQNPLNFVNNFTQLSRELLDEEVLLDENPESKQLLKDYLSKINYHGKRAEVIVRELLNHTHNTTGNKQLVDINNLCEEYFMFSYNCMCVNYKDLICEVEILKDPMLPKYNCVSQHLSKVLINLSNNAFYAVRGIKNARVTLTIESLDTCHKICISDNGSGIPIELKNKIFDPFFTTKSPGNGTGLGLSICNDIIKSYGGSIEVESHPFILTRFTIILPLHKY